MLSIVMLLSGGLIARETAQLTPEFVREWFAYTSQKMALAQQEFASMANLNEQDDFTDALDEIAEEFEELAEEFKKIKVPNEGIVVSKANEERWAALKKEGQALYERKRAQLDQPQVKEVVLTIVED